MTLDFFEEEDRSGFHVSKKRKQVWAAELRILEEFDRICRENDLSYFIDYGTLLGAVRHGGFIPWDDDIDVSMLRDDYMRLCELAKTVVKEPFFFQNSDTDNLVMSFSKLRDERTAAIEFWDNAAAHQGIFIDIFPMDDVPEPDGTGNNIFLVEKELWNVAYDEETIREQMKRRKFGLKHWIVLDDETLKMLLKALEQERMQQYETFCASHFGNTSGVNYLLEEFYRKEPPQYILRAWVEETVRIPFEHMMLPAPKEYEAVLKQRFGDWKTPVMGGSAHENKIFFDPEKSYREYFADEKLLEYARTRKSL
ncbi:MAG: phosphorylcholine transferase LicD [Lachnospiraceae bacterium]